MVKQVAQLNDNFFLLFENFKDKFLGQSDAISKIYVFRGKVNIWVDQWNSVMYSRGWAPKEVDHAYSRILQPLQSFHKYCIDIWPLLIANYVFLVYYDEKSTALCCFRLQLLHYLRR